MILAVGLPQPSEALPCDEYDVVVDVRGYRVIRPARACRPRSTTRERVAELAASGFSLKDTWEQQRTPRTFRYEKSATQF
jgi:hypothetical protein